MERAGPTHPPPGDSALGPHVKSILDFHLRGLSVPPGPADRVGVRATRRMQLDPVGLFRPLHDEFGPVFTVRLVGRPTVVALGPEAARYMYVQNPSAFSWREGDFGVLTPVLGDSLITTDGAPHDDARKLMMPAFHRQRMGDAAEIMASEALAQSAQWRPGDTVDVYAWMRHTALRIAMRALLGLDPDDHGSGYDVAELFEEALSFFGKPPLVQMARGPRSARAEMQRVVAKLDIIVNAQIAERRRDGVEGRTDVLSMLMQARDENGRGFSDRELRDHSVTLMFGGHDTSSSTLAFMLYELARRPDVQRRVHAEQASTSRTAEDLTDGMPELAAAMDETLRLYPPVWVSPRRTVEEVELGGHRVSSGVNVMLFSYVSHRLPEYFEQPDDFRPERFHPDNRNAIVAGSYFPFGGGSRICIGKRFGQLVVRAVASAIVERFAFSLAPGFELEIMTTPTLSPKNGVPLVLRDPAG